MCVRAIFLRQISSTRSKSDETKKQCNEKKQHRGTRETRNICTRKEEQKLFFSTAFPVFFLCETPTNEQTFFSSLRRLVVSFLSLHLLLDTQKGHVWLKTKKKKEKEKALGRSTSQKVTQEKKNLTRTNTRKKSRGNRNGAMGVC